MYVCIQQWLHVHHDADGRHLRLLGLLQFEGPFFLLFLRGECGERDSVETDDRLEKFSRVTSVNFPHADREALRQSDKGQRRWLRGGVPLKIRGSPITARKALWRDANEDGCIPYWDP